MGNIAADFYPDGHTCSQSLLTGEACLASQNLLDFLPLFLSALPMAVVEILLVAIVAWIYIIIKPPFYRQRFRRWLSLLERRAAAVAI